MHYDRNKADERIKEICDRRKWTLQELTPDLYEISIPGTKHGTVMVRLQPFTSWLRVLQTKQEAKYFDAEVWLITNLF